MMCVTHYEPVLTHAHADSVARAAIPESSMTRCLRARASWCMHRPRACGISMLLLGSCLLSLKLCSQCKFAISGKTRSRDTNSQDGHWQSPCREGLKVAKNQTFAIEAVELRRHPPFIGSLTSAHDNLPLSWTFHLFHLNFSNTAHAANIRSWWQPDGDLGRLIAKFRRIGRKVTLHTFPDRWFAIQEERGIDRIGNVYPRMEAFWRSFPEDKVLTIESDTARCANSPWSIADFECYDYIGPLTHLKPPGYKPTKPPIFNGGFSLRSPQAMLACIEAAKAAYPNQPIYSTKHNGVGDLWYRGVGRRGVVNEDMFYSLCLQTAAMRQSGFLPGDPKAAVHFGRERSAFHHMRSGAAPPWGIHDVCRDIAIQGNCTDDVKNPELLRCSPGWDLTAAFASVERHCGSNLEHLAQKCPNWVEYTRIRSEGSRAGHRSISKYKSKYRHEYHGRLSDS